MMMNEIDLIEQAYEFYASGDVKEALAKLDQAIAKAADEGDQLNQARAMGKKGVILLEADQLEAARVCLEEVLAFSEELENQELKADALSNLGLVFTKSGDPGTGLLKQQEATFIARETENRSLVMTHLGLLGHAYIQLANMEEAGKVYFEALPIAKEIGDISAQCGFLNNLGIIFGNLDQHENAIRAFLELSDLAVESGDYTLALNAEKNLVKHAIAEGKIEEIISHSRKGLDLIKTHLSDANDEREAFEEMLLLGLMSKRDYAAAEQEIIEIIKKAETVGNKPKLLTALGQIADAHYALGKIADAEEEYQRALDLSVRLQEKSIQARILGRLAAISADQDDLEKSNQFLFKGLEISNALKDQAILGEQHYLLALNYKELENLEQALEHAHKSVECYLASGSDSPGVKARALLESLLSS